MAEGYYHTKESVNQYIEAAKGFDGRELINKLKLLLPQNSKVLELGSGPGKDWEILSEFFEVTGSDLSEHFLIRLKDTYPKETFLSIDAATLQTNEKFDAIYSNKVLHHLSDEELQRSIKRQSDILNPKGLICHSFWKGKGSESFNGMFVNYHDEKDLKKSFSSYFDIEVLNTYKEFDDNDSLLVIAKKK